MQPTTIECDNCGDTTNVWQNGSGEVQCDNCGYEETEENYE